MTLFEDGVALFPDAPTERGVKHVRELMAAAAEGFEAYIIFVVKRSGAEYFSPNRRTHPEFAAALKEAQAAGVQLVAVECTVSPECITAHAQIPIKL